MTAAQLRLYRFEASSWRTARRARGLPARDEDRHALHLRVLGHDKSSLELTNADLDKILAAFRAESHPDDLSAQLRQIDQPEKRLASYMTEIDRLLTRIVSRPGSEAAYLGGMKSRIFGLRASDTLTEQQAAKLAGILRLQVRRIDAKHAPKSPDENPF